ncbi:tryptophan synthase subunit alpha [soil metagenome]
MPSPTVLSNRIDDTFAALRARRVAAFVAYVGAGDPTMDATLEIVLSLEEAGADIVELGLPFSDPLADGIVNQLSAQRALEAGATTPKILDLIRRIRQRSQIPLVLFTYLNPVYAYGYKKFLLDASEAGADGILALDLPPDEAILNDELRDATGLRQIRLISPTTPDARIRQIAAASEGFIYYVSREGVTGAQSELAHGIAGQVGKIKAATDVPVVVGFGISTPEQAATVARLADGVVVGSAIVKRIADGATPAELAAFVSPLAAATKS